MSKPTIIVIDHYNKKHTILKRNFDNIGRTLIPYLNSSGCIIGSIHRENIKEVIAGGLKPVDKLKMVLLR
ncbi:MAG: hypothetical protein ACI92O_000434 [Colwellia sp.]|jgi:hypothetical protein